MSPIRLVIIGILLYIGYLLIKGSGGKSKKKKQESERNGASTVDVLVEDPVCKKLVPRQQAIRSSHGGKTIYFCSKECCTAFATDKGADK